MIAGWFVTGTDTEVGKTFATCALIRGFRAAGRRVAAMKPVAAGTDADGSNDDVRRLLAASGLDLPPDAVNPYLFAPPIAPHIAAADAGQRIDLGRIRRAAGTLAAAADILMVEGVGGFRVPLDGRVDSADLAVALGLPMILVVGLRLGCINHALLSAEAIAARGLRLDGWIANRIDPAMLRPEASVDALRERIDAPLLGLLPWLDAAAAAAEFLILPGSESLPSPIGQGPDLQG